MDSLSGMDHNTTSKSIHLQVNELNCASCVETARKALLANSLVDEVSISVQTGRAVIKGSIDATEAARIVTASGYPSHVIDDAPESAADMHEQMERRSITHERQWRRRAIIGLGIWLPMGILHWTSGPLDFDGPWLHWVLGILATTVVAIVGPGFFLSAWSALKRGGTNMDTLITIGAGTAWLY